MKLDQKKALVLIVVLIIGLGAIYLYQRNISNKPLIAKNPVVVNSNPVVEVASSSDEVINSATFNCVAHMTIQAIFFKDKVKLGLSDGRDLVLPQVISASGARYANSDESIVFWNKGDSAFITESGLDTYSDCSIVLTGEDQTASSSSVSSSTTSVGLANPASVNCTKQGGTLLIQKSGNGGEYGLCNFQDNRSCEEWAMMRGDCPVGGVKTTGFDTIDQKYCAWLGGVTYAVSNSVCGFKDGTKCPTLSLYNGECPLAN